MIDVKLPLRTAYYQLLNGNIVYNTAIVPISTDIRKLADSAALIYVILRAQTGTDKSTMASFDSQEEVIIDIVNKAKTRVNNEIIDSIANQILGLVLPAPVRNGLPSQIGIQIDCVQLTGDRYLDMVLNSSTTAIRRILTFTQKVRQTGLSVAPPMPATFQSPISSIDFFDANTYVNPALKNVNYYLFLNGIPGFLQAGVQYTVDPDGGFQILIPDFDATQNDYTIYILLK